MRATLDPVVKISGQSRSQLEDNSEIVLLVTGYSDRHVSFVASYHVSRRVDRVRAPVETV